MLVDGIRNIAASFRDSQMERNYRNHYLAADKKQFVVGVLIGIIPFILLIKSDYDLFGFSQQFYILLTIRFSFIAISMFAVLILLRIKDFLYIDYTVLIWLFLYFVFIIALYTTRPLSNQRNTYLDIVIVLLIYLLFNIRFSLQIIPPLLYTAISIIFVINRADSASIVSLNAIVVTYIASNVLGVVFSWRLQIYRRVQYSYYINEKKLNTQLVEALNNVKTLKGLMPICSNCKKIRDDKGYWKQLEEFIELHSDAQFSHSLCEECAQELYGKEKWFNKHRR